MSSQPSSSILHDGANHSVGVLQEQQQPVPGQTSPVEFPFQQYPIHHELSYEMRAPSRWRVFATQALRGVVLLLLGVGLIIGLLTRHTADSETLTSMKYPRELILRAQEQFTWASANQGDKQEDLCRWTKYRLPTSAYPTRYDLHTTLQSISTNGKQAWWVFGQVTIELEVFAATPCLVLHADETLKVETALIDGQQVVVSPSPKVEQQIVLTADEDLLPGHHVISATFSYELNDGLKGFYRSQYKDTEGKEHFIATTQFEADYARFALPCFDEPAMKARFAVTITAPQEFAVLSNMPPKATAAPPADAPFAYDGSKTVVFEETPPMSTYLLAWVVGELTSVSTTIPGPNGDRTIAVWGGLHRTHELDYALGEAAALVLAQEKLLGVPFTLPKLEYVAIPDFAFGAMENWGLITFRETYLMLDPADATVGQYEGVTSVISHELGHQWFGNLVSPAWWGDLWLNEGFATYLEYYGTQLVRPEFDFMGDIFYDYMLVGLKSDALPSVHAMYSPPEDVDFAGALEGRFDDTVYEKSGSVIRMFRTRMAELAGGYPFDAFAQRPRPRSAGSRDLSSSPGTPPADAGSDPFVQALRAYLQEHQFGVATTSDLWAAVGSKGSQGEGEQGLVWSSQPGFPIVTVRDSPSGGLEVVQRAMSNGNVVECGTAGTVPWPVSLQEAGGQGDAPAPRTLHDTCTPVPLPLSPPGDHTWPQRPFLLLNPGRREYYRVDYGPLWPALLDAVAAPDGGAAAIPATDLAGLLDDAFFLLEEGGAGVTGATFMRLAQSISKRPNTDEIQRTPWRVFISRVSQLLQLAPPGDCALGLRTFAYDKAVKPFLAAQFGGVSPAAAMQAFASQLWHADKVADVGPLRMTRLLSDVFSFAAKLGADEELSAVALKLMQGGNGALEGPLRVSPDLRYPVTVAALNGNQQDSIAVFEYVRQLYEHPTSAGAEGYYKEALFSVSTEPAVTAVTKFAFTPAVRPADFSKLLSRLASQGGDTLTHVWDYLTSHVADIKTKSGAASEVEQLRFTLAAILAVGKYFADEEGLRAVQNVVADLKFWDTDAEQPIEAARAMDLVAANMERRQQVLPTVCEYLQVEEA